MYQISSLWVRTRNGNIEVLIHDGDLWRIVQVHSIYYDGVLSHITHEGGLINSKVDDL